MAYNMKGSPMLRNFGIGASPVKQTEEMVSKTSPGEGWTKTKGTNIWAPPKKEKMMMKESKQLKKSVETPVVEESDLSADMKADLLSRRQKTAGKKMHATLTKKLKPKTKTLPEKLQEKKDKQKIFRK